MSVLAVIGLFFVLLAGAGDEAVLRYVGPPILCGLLLGALVIAILEWRDGMRGLR